MSDEVFDFPASDVLIEPRKIYEVQIDTPAQLNPEGQAEVIDCLWSAHGFTPEFYSSWSWLWEYTDREVGLAGTLPKRIFQYYWKSYGIKLEDAIVSQLGNLAKRNTISKSVAYVDVTDQFDWGERDFGQVSPLSGGASCYWGGRKKAKNWLESNGGLAIRFWSTRKVFDYDYRVEQDDRTWHGYGRAWMWRHDSHTTLFNVYGFDGRNQEAAAIAASLLKTNYNRISICNFGTLEGDLWLNHYDSANGAQENKGANAFGLGKADTLNLLKRNGVFDMRLDTTKPLLRRKKNADGTFTCNNCRKHVDELLESPGGYLCPDCLDATCFTCPDCQTLHARDSGFDHDNVLYCENCYHWEGCYNCGDEVDRREAAYYDGDYYCDLCASRLLFTCVSCEERMRKRYAHETRDGEVCSACRESYYSLCRVCGEYVNDNDSTWDEDTDTYTCDQCQEHDHEDIPTTDARPEEAQQEGEIPF